LALSTYGNLDSSLSNPITRYLWHFGAKGWPLERIDTVTGEHVPVLIGVPEELLRPQDYWSSLACSIPQVSGVVWDWRC
jgi:hypothetical protein